MDIPRIVRTLANQLARDARYAFRTLRRSPGFTVFTLLTFAVAIGGLSTIFSLVNVVLLKPLAYPEADRLVMVLEASAQNPVGGYSVAAPNYIDWQQGNDVFERMALYEYLGYNLAGGAEPQQVSGLRVTGGVFELLRVAPLLGRGLMAADDSGANGRVAVLSHRLWRRTFGGDSAIVGRSIRLNGEPWQIVGVMPPNFAFPSVGQDIWTPIRLTGDDLNRASHSFFAIARLKDGVSLARARAVMRAMGARLAAAYPASNAGETVNVFPMRDLWVQDVQHTLQILLVAVSLVLLIASANVASLQVARDAARRREIAARLTLGGSPARIVGQLVTESVVLALGGALLGLVLAVFGIRGLVTLFPPGLRYAPFRDLSAVSLDPTVFGFAVLVALLAGIAAGLLPAMTALPSGPAELLRESGGARSSATRRTRRIKSLLIGVEVALTMVVLVGAGLLLSSIRRVHQVPPGLDATNVVALRVELPQPDAYGPGRRATWCTDVRREVGALPGVVAVSAVSHLPLSGSNAGHSFVIEGASDPGPANLPAASYGVVCPGYFRTMGIPLVMGRDFSEADRADAPPVMIINERLRARWFPKQDPLGRRFKLGRFTSKTPWVTIVGVVGDVHHGGLMQPPEPYFYAPYAQAAWPSMSVTVRTRGAPQAQLRAIREGLRRATPAEPIGEATTMEQVLQASLGHLRFPVVLFSVFAALALSLAALGCFGLAMQTVVQRRRELAIRIALGAQARQVYRMVIAQSMTPVSWGLVAGIAAALAGTGILRDLLYGITPTDPTMLALGATLLATITAAACFVPARRAARLDPATVLRED